MGCPQVEVVLQKATAVQWKGLESTGKKIDAPQPLNFSRYCKLDQLLQVSPEFDRKFPEF